MCGRFSLTVSIETLKAHFQVQQGFYLKQRYNIAPTETIPVLKVAGVVDFLRWGFVSSWLNLKENTANNGFANARSETISQKPVFREAFRKRRCLIIADGYYEWKQLAKIKQPYYIQRKDKQVFAFAGIWENDTCAILTTVAHARLSEIHQRMPVILEPNAYLPWLDPNASLQKLESLLCPTVPLNDKNDLEIIPVSTRVNNPTFESPECIRSLI